MSRGQQLSSNRAEAKSQVERAIRQIDAWQEHLSPAERARLLGALRLKLRGWLR